MNNENPNTNERDLPRAFADNVRRLRNERNLSCKQLGKMLGISSSYINRIEKYERRRVSYTIIKNLSNVFEMDISDLFAEDSDMYVSHNELKHGIFLQMKSIIAESSLTHEQKMQQLKALDSICQFLLAS